MRRYEVMFVMRGIHWSFGTYYCRRRRTRSANVDAVVKTTRRRRPSGAVAFSVPLVRRSPNLRQTPRKRSVSAGDDERSSAFFSRTVFGPRKCRTDPTGPPRYSDYRKRNYVHAINTNSCTLRVLPPSHPLRKDSKSVYMWRVFSKFFPGVLKFSENVIELILSFNNNTDMGRRLIL